MSRILTFALILSLHNKPVGSTIDMLAYVGLRCIGTLGLSSDTQTYLERIAYENGTLASGLDLFIPCSLIYPRYDVGFCGAQNGLASHARSLLRSGYLIRRGADPYAKLELRQNHQYASLELQDI